MNAEMAWFLFIFVLGVSIGVCFQYHTICYPLGAFMIWYGCFYTINPILTVIFTILGIICINSGARAAEKLRIEKEAMKNLDKIKTMQEVLQNEKLN